MEFARLQDPEPQSCNRADGLNPIAPNQQKTSMTTDKNVPRANNAPRSFRLNASAITLAAVAAFLLPTGASRAQGSNEIGRWLDHTGDGAVELYACGNKVCGRIVWLRNPLGKDGQPLHDGYNPNPTMRTRPICGLQVIGNLERQGDGSLDGGWVYDPKVGKSYNAALDLEGRNNLVLTGYLGARLFGKSFTWTRAPGNLTLCSAPVEAPR